MGFTWFDYAIVLLYLVGVTVAGVVISGTASYAPVSIR